MEPDGLCQIFRYKMVSQEYGGEERWMSRRSEVSKKKLTKNVSGCD